MTVMQAIRVAAATRRAAASATTLRSMSTAVMPPPLYITGPNGKVLSPWHDIPLRPSADPSVFNFVCEIPKGVKPPKLEIDTGKQWNPIVQVSDRRLLSNLIGWPGDATIISATHS